MAINEEEFNSMKESIKELTSFVQSLQKRYRQKAQSRRGQG